MQQPSRLSAAFALKASSVASPIIMKAAMRDESAHDALTRYGKLRDRGRLASSGKMSYWDCKMLSLDPSFKDIWASPDSNVRRIGGSAGPPCMRRFQ
jgi:hypothetical protein